jgi:hypothetical protein
MPQFSEQRGGRFASPSVCRSCALGNLRLSRAEAVFIVAGTGIAMAIISRVSLATSLGSRPCLHLQATSSVSPALFARRGCDQQQGRRRNLLWMSSAIGIVWPRRLKAASSTRPVGEFHMRWKPGSMPTWTGGGVTQSSHRLGASTSDTSVNY